MTSRCIICDVSTISDSLYINGERKQKRTTILSNGLCTECSDEIYAANREVDLEEELMFIYSDEEFDPIVELEKELIANHVGDEDN